MTFIAEMTRALAWPVALVALCLIFSTRLSGVLEGVKLRRITRGEFSADFETGAQEVRAELAGPAQAPAGPGGPELLTEETERLIDVAPAAAISQMWNELEGLVAIAASQAGIARGLLPETLRALVDKRLIQPSVRDSILGLRNLRNLAVHAPPGRLTTGQAREFAAMAEAAMWSLEQNLNRPLSS